MTREEKERIFHDNEKLIYFTLNKHFPTYKAYYEELYQDCALLIWKILDNYKEDKGKISTYLVFCMKRECYKKIKKYSCGSKIRIIVEEKDGIESLLDKEELCYVKSISQKLHKSNFPSLKSFFS